MKPILQRSIPIVLAAVLCLVSQGAFAATELTACNQDIDDDVYLTADLDCTGTSGFGLNLRGRSTLSLNGFSIRNAELNVVQCWGRCSIVGPGSFVGNGAGPRSVRKMKIQDVAIDGGLVGVEGYKLEITDSSITNAKYGIFVTRKLVLVDSTIEANLQYGIGTTDPDSCTTRVKLENSSVTGNATDTTCTGPDGCADIVSCAAPRLDTTSACGTSLQSSGTDSWGVCSGD